MSGYDGETRFPGKGVFAIKTRLSPLSVYAHLARYSDTCDCMGATRSDSTSVCLVLTRYVNLDAFLVGTR